MHYNLYITLVHIKANIDFYGVIIYETKVKESTLYVRIFILFEDEIIAFILSSSLLLFLHENEKQKLKLVIVLDNAKSTLGVK